MGREGDECETAVYAVSGSGELKTICLTGSIRRRHSCGVFFISVGMHTRAVRKELPDGNPRAAHKSRERDLNSPQESKFET